MSFKKLLKNHDRLAKKQLEKHKDVRPFTEEATRNETSLTEIMRNNKDWILRAPYRSQRENVSKNLERNLSSIYFSLALGMNTVKVKGLYTLKLLD
jgi:predicted  nucleic acid-binding Zn-ribbon protein